jgi:biotin operon repressor
MNHKFASTKVILDLLVEYQHLSATEISEKLGKSRVIIHRYLKSLLSDGKVIKIGTAPHTRYQLKDTNLVIPTLRVCTIEDTKKYKNGFPIHWENFLDISFSDRKILDEYFLKFSPTGKKYEWMSGFIAWCLEREYNTEKQITNFLSIVKHIEKEQNICGLLSVREAFWKDFDSVALDTVYYADQYKWMEFGRGKLAELTFYAKQSQNKTLIAESVSLVLPKLECLIAHEKPDAIAITPWSIERKNQLLHALKKSLTPQGISFVSIVKYHENGIAIPQKSLKTREERLLNAQNTIFIDDKNIKNYKKILLIDDFVGSGATLNETAKKLKAEWVKEVIGFAWVGNTNLSYEVIREI